MAKHLSLEEHLLSGFEYPIVLIIEVTKKGVILSKLRYLKALGQFVNEMIRCPCIEVYCHMDRYEDPYIAKGTRPTGIDWIFTFNMDRRLYKDTLRAIRTKDAKININNPHTAPFAKKLQQDILSGNISFKRLDASTQGLLLEPYCYLAFCRSGQGKRIVLQNVEIINREPSLRVRGPEFDALYSPNPAPLLEVDIMVIIEIADVYSLLTGLKDFGFSHDKSDVRGDIENVD